MKNIPDTQEEQAAHRRTGASTSLVIPLVIASAQLAFVLLFHDNYGYFRDELYYIACSDHLAWGYVDQPPLSIVVLALVRWIAGDSLHAIRFLAATAGAGVVVLSALMARRLGGGRFAQSLAALCVVAAPVLLGNGRYFSMNAFDVFFWAVAMYLIIVTLERQQMKSWMLFGGVIGLGLLNKYSIGFLCIGLVAGLLLTRHRSHLASKWFWLGALIAFLLFVPHLVWEIQHGMPTLEFMRNASQNKNVSISAVEFLLGQFRDVNFFNAPIWLLGLYYFFFDREGNRYRTLGWAYVVVFIVMVTGNAKVYYLAPIYPVMLAGGAVLLGRAIRERSWNWLKPVVVSLVTAGGMIAAPFTIPLLNVEDFIAYQKALGLTRKAEERISLGVLPQHYADMFGWEEMVATVANVYNKLTPEEQAKCVLYVRNYGEAGAIDLFGKKYGLPPALCAHNNYWLWGPGTRTGDVAIIVGDSRELQENLDDLTRVYRQVELVATTKCDYCMPYETGRQLFLCKGMKTTFQNIWPAERFYI